VLPVVIRLKVFYFLIFKKKDFMVKFLVWVLILHSDYCSTVRIFHLLLLVYIYF